MGREFIAVCMTPVETSAVRTMARDSGSIRGAIVPSLESSLSSAISVRETSRVQSWLGCQSTKLPTAIHRQVTDEAVIARATNWGMGTVSESSVSPGRQKPLVSIIGERIQIYG